MSKTLISTSKVANLYHSLTEESDREAVVNFLRFGDKGKDVVCVFDRLLEVSLRELSGLYREFALRSEEGSLLRQAESEETVALLPYAMHSAAVIIQCASRKRQASRRVQRLRLQQREERKRREDEEAAFSLRRKARLT